MTPWMTPTLILAGIDFRQVAADREDQRHLERMASLEGQQFRLTPEALQGRARAEDFINLHR